MNKLRCSKRMISEFMEKSISKSGISGKHLRKFNYNFSYIREF